MTVSKNRPFFVLNGKPYRKGEVAVKRETIETTLGGELGEADDCRVFIPGKIEYTCTAIETFNGWRKILFARFCNVTLSVRPSGREVVYVEGKISDEKAETNPPPRTIGTQSAPVD